ncbi:BON domain-containing protein [Devosia sp. RR2S18]|uniref:BON domain-containing protein n=1 Tax=Devosia rhizosphaerae TaxID=3049774 RepID=UPI0025408017|nr:BON domain-containing protein [Devosia sp. RR2S18]WIJ26986.1 BON domain-containing protein [Devosia sp. RR2S18]
MNSLNKSTCLRRDENIADRVIEALWQDAFLDAHGMEVTVQDGVVTLRGHDLDRLQVERAIKLIDDLPIVDDVVDGTTSRKLSAAA